MNPSFILGITLLALGFGFVVFWHELGHFLAAKWAKVKVEQFAVGFGQAVLCWRKGMKLQVGTTTPRYEKLAREEYHRLHGEAAAPPTPLQLDESAASIGLGETEYRLNWLPLGGYVKMLGQDDLDPTSQSTDPRSYNRKPVAKRMVIISAGVVMNIILAFALYCTVFLMGFNAPPPIIGSVSPNSPAQRAGLQVGDRILEIDGKTIRDFTKIEFSVPISRPNYDLPIKFERDGKTMMTTARPAPQDVGTGSLLQLGIARPPEMAAISPKFWTLSQDKREQEPGKSLPVWPGERIVQIGDLRIEEKVSGQAYIDQLKKVDALLQSSAGQPITLRVVDEHGNERQTHVQPTPDASFDLGDFQVLGLTPRVKLLGVENSSNSMKAKAKDDDIILSVRLPNDSLQRLPSIASFREATRQVGAKSGVMTLEVLRGKETLTLEKLSPDKRVARDRYGFSVALDTDLESPVVGTVAEKSPAADAGVEPGSTILSLNKQPTANWYELLKIASAAKAGESLELAYRTPSGEEKVAALKVDAASEQRLASNRYTGEGFAYLRSHDEPRRTANPLTAAWWGVLETRDKITELYTTLRRILFDQSVSATNLMGPVGIFHSGSIIANRGPDWLLWFLAMISANLAVVNFLPLPIVDGGHFCFLLLEKITGRPPSPRLQQATQLVGLALILSLFLFVTFQDITRIWIS